MNARLSDDPLMQDAAYMLRHGREMTIADLGRALYPRTQTGRRPMRIARLLMEMEAAGYKPTEHKDLITGITLIGMCTEQVDVDWTIMGQGDGVRQCRVRLARR